MLSSSQSFVVFSGTSNKKLSTEIAGSLGVKLGDLEIKDFPDGEIGVRVSEVVRGRDVFVVQSMAKKPNFYLMELLIIIDALKRASAKAIYPIIPYYCYSRQDRKNEGREPITAKLVADLLEKSGADGVISMDLHTDQIEGFFNIPVDHLRSSSTIIDSLKKHKIDDLVVVSPDVGSLRLGREYSSELSVDLAVLNKRRLNPKQVEASALIGEVTGKNVLLVDDICSTGETIKNAAKVCKALGAKKVYAAIAHGLNDHLLEDDPVIEKVFVTNSIERSSSSSKCEIVSVGKLFAKAIEKIIS